MCELIRENFSGVSKMLPKYSINHFVRPLLLMLATKKSKQTKQKKTENSKLVHMHTGNTKAGKSYIRKDDR